MSTEDWSTGMAEMFERAQRDGLWFHASYQDLWFSPGALEKAQAEGRFRWGAVNWTLRNHQEQIDYLERAAEAAAREVERFAAKVKEAPHGKR